MIRSLLIAGLLPVPAFCLSLDLPASAEMTLEEERPLDSTTIASGPFDGSVVPMADASGTVSVQAWRLQAAGLTTLQILEPLAKQLEAEGFDALYTCESEACGGFDFRFALETLPPPAMHVSLNDFRYLSARKGEDEYAALLVSRTSRAAYLQITSVTTGEPGEDAGLSAAPGAPLVPAEQVAPGSFGERLETAGHVTLGDLTFETGSAQLGEGTYESLAALAEYLESVPNRRVALVGHTDSEGSLDGNIALSRRRAASVLERLATTYGIPRRQLEAHGMGYLAPVASNLTEEGREANRRVEVIVLSE
ncbi:OmpA family protein [Pelagovum pacificum]|uniref:OmpA family protein n=2 Tax=Pelagovum pacificum TaxID=2588711 RepID=A0A5C5GI86_9RHOB|nr:OmpA family protein [Pelagovum pacificum]QQA45046.1 OmpA family protein [Pelagovum pacificum]TNY34413.1 OmpA family protein [Pelagovum pacificum]